jgi:MFS family permease
MFGARLPRTFWVLWAGMLLNRLGGFVVPFLTLYLTQQRGFTAARAGLVVSMWGIGTLVSGPLGGALADWIGRRATMIGGLVFGGLSMLHLGAARAPGHIAVAAFLLGLAGELYRPPVQAAVADLVPPEERPRAYGYMYWAANLGFAIAASLGGLLAQRSYWLLFAGDAFTTIAFAAVVWWLVPETRTARSTHGQLQGLVVPFRDGVFMLFVALAVLLATVFFQGFSTLPLEMSARGHSADRYGALIALNGVLIVVLQPLGLRLVTRLDSSHLLAAATLLVGIGYGATQFAHTPLQYASTIAIWTLAEVAFSPIWPSVVADLAPASLRGTYQGVFQVSLGGAFFLAPALGTYVLQHHGSQVLWTGCFLLSALTAAGHLVVGGARRRRIEMLRRGAADELAAPQRGLA